MAEQTDDRLLAVEDGSRRALVRLAYRMLGSVEEAEDVVQDAHLKLLGIESLPDDPHAYLFRVVTNLSIDRLRHLKVQRRTYHGPWLPEPLVTEPVDGQRDAELADDLSMALLLMLERLSVTERVAFVLREACELSFPEMARVLNVQVDACRQRYHRARRKLSGARRPPAPAPAQRQALERLVDAVSAGDTGRLADLLSDDALLLTDGGGRVSAAVRPVEDPRRIAQVLVHLSTRDDHRGYSTEYRFLNGGVGLLIRLGGPGGEVAAYASVQVDVAVDGRISRIYVVRNPQKLARLRLA